MNTNRQSVITTDQYFALSAKKELTPFEEILKKNYEDFIELATSNEKYITPTTEKILSEYNFKVLNGTNLNQEAPKEEILKEQTSEYTLSRSMKKAGYINASVILVVLLNIGFIIAMTIVFMKK